MKYKIFFTLLCFIKFGFSQDCRTRTLSNIVMPACNTQEYQLLFEDDFNDNILNPNKWTKKSGVIRNFSFSHEKQWLMPENVEVYDGTLKIIAKKLEIPIVGEWVTNWNTTPFTTDNSTFNYTSGEIWTNQKIFNQGKYEIRCKLPKGKGYWPAFWIYEGGVETQNEIDFFEIYGDNIYEYTCNVYSGFDLQNNRRYSCVFEKIPIPLIDFSEWHIFTCIWDPEKITFYVDDKVMREYYKFKVDNINDDPIECNDEIFPDTYKENLVWPTENMELVINLAIRSNDNSPNSNTVFPGIYEVDYVRVYSKPEPSCVDCLSEMNFVETNNLPGKNLTRNLITASNNVKISANKDVTFNSNQIELRSGFTAIRGSSFLANVQSCNEYNSFSNPIQFSTNAVNGYQIFQCINPIFSLNLSGVLFYEIKVYDIYDDMRLVCESSGEPNSNIIDVCNTLNFQPRAHRVDLTLTNCLGSDFRTFNLDIIPGNCKSISNFSNLNNEELEIENGINIYPNPSNTKINIIYTSKQVNPFTKILVIDSNGKIIKSLIVESKIGINKEEIDISNLNNGVYILSLFNIEERIVEKIVILE